MIVAKKVSELVVVVANALRDRCLLNFHGKATVGRNSKTLL